MSEMQKEQADVETMMRQLSLGQKIKKKRDTHTQIIDDRIFNIVSRYQSYVEDDNVLGYLRAIGHNLRF